MNKTITVKEAWIKNSIEKKNEFKKTGQIHIVFYSSTTYSTGTIGTVGRDSVEYRTERSSRIKSYPS